MTPQQQQAMDTLAAWASDPARGLPEEFFLFLSRFTPLVNVDLLIRDDRGRTLLTWREDDFYGAGWHIPGGIIRYKEAAAARVHATALEEIGAGVHFEPAPISIEEAFDPGHSERGHFISLLYACRLNGAADENRRYRSGTPRRGEWAWHDGCPPDFLPAQAFYRRFF